MPDGELWENSYHHLTMGFLTADGLHSMHTAGSNLLTPFLVKGKYSANLVSALRERPCESQHEQLGAYFLSRKNGLVGLIRKRDKASPRF
jgi:hypothetical protein